LRLSYGEEWSVVKGLYRLVTTKFQGSFMFFTKRLFLKPIVTEMFFLIIIKCVVLIEFNLNSHLLIGSFSNESEEVFQIKLRIKLLLLFLATMIFYVFALIIYKIVF